MDVAETQRTILPHDIGPVKTAVVPHRFAAGRLAVLHRHDAGRRSLRETLLEPSPRFGQRLYGQGSRPRQRIRHCDLVFQSAPHPRPGKRILLSDLRILESQARPVGQHVEKPIDPNRVAAPFGIGGLQRLDSLGRKPEPAIVLVDRIAAEHPEHRDADLLLRSLRRHVGIFTARVISLVPVTAPQRVTVRSHLIAAIARSDDPVTIGHVLQRMRVDEPRSDRRRIGPENLFEFGHVDVDQFFALFGSISRRKTYVRVPVPRIGPAPRHAGRFDVRLGDLPPAAYFGTLFQRPAHQFLITRIEQRVVLQQESPAQAVFFQQFDLPERCQEKILVRNIHRTRLGLANEINNIHDAGRRFFRPLPAGDQTLGQTENGQPFHDSPNQNPFYIHILKQ